MIQLDKKSNQHFNFSIFMHFEAYGHVEERLKTERPIDRHSITPLLRKNT